MDDKTTVKPDPDGYFNFAGLPITKDQIEVARLGGYIKDGKYYLPSVKPANTKEK